MSFASLHQPSIDGVIERLSEASQATLIVGAGASMEADLPSWHQLLDRLLAAVADRHPGLTTPETRREWVDATLQQEDLLAAGAVVEVLATEPLEELIPQALFGPAGPEAYEPGPIAEQVARLRQTFGTDLALLTTNYDDLIERALNSAGVAKRHIKSYVRRRLDPPAGSVPVTHLHGFAGRDGETKNLVLTEEHYHRMQRGSSWQEQLVTQQLQSTTCLFIGTSLADPNLIRYLYGYEQSRRVSHAAVFVRQGSGNSGSSEARAAREESVVARWGRCGVEAIFVDHFGDAAQLLYEIGLRRQNPAAYQSVTNRAASALRSVKDELILESAPRVEFARRQVELSSWLRDTLYELLEEALGGPPPADERFALTLWLLADDGSSLTGWAHSDRAHQDPSTIEAVAIATDSDWVAVRAICQGTKVDLDRRSAVSRWRFVRGLPLIIDTPSRLPLGCLTISSTRGSEETVLTTMSATARAKLHRGLVGAMNAELSRLAS